MKILYMIAYLLLFHLLGIAKMAHLVANYFSWNPVGAIRAGRNPATYKYHGETLHIDGKLLKNWEYNSMKAKQ